MAKQHFYSRVPARVSMFNRTDGFDTFAHSEGVEREFIERELSAVCENKLGKNDMEAVRKNLMPLVYSQNCLRSGSVVQSCIRYLPKDYTGERSAYLCHSLILTEEEQQLLSREKDVAVMNPQMFDTDPTAFNFTALDATADSHYPEKTYVPAPAPDPKELTERYDPDSLKNFLAALICILCAKGKPVYFRLACDDQSASDEALKLINSIVAVIPYHLRKGISFVTYITDPAQYPATKVKCVSDRCPDVPVAKGVFIDFATGHVSGMPAGEIVASIPINFLYSLLSDTAMRNEFLLFIDTAVKSVPGLERMSIKNLADLVFLFGGASGLFPMQTILSTDDLVYDFLCIYDKYRSALSGEYRRNVYKCLERYPQRHTAIPKNIFLKLSRLYPGEVHGAKRVAMNTVLELIHTDIMRDKLFTFIKNNYSGEDPDIRAIINEDLCRVFYGGFLQPQILDFFSVHYLEEPETVQNMVFDKLMLTIRTDSIQKKILEFIDNNYQSLTEAQKQRFYDTVYEMLPECDALSEALIQLVNAKADDECEALKEKLSQKLADALEADSRKREHKLLPLLCSQRGFCEGVASKLVLGPWKNRKIYGEYIALLAQRDIVTKTEELAYVLETALKEDEAAVSQLILSKEEIYANIADSSNLYQLLETEKLVQTKLRAANMVFAHLVETNLIRPAIAQRVTDVFNTRLRKDGLPYLIQYAKENPYLADAQQYRIVKTFQKLCAAIEKKDAYVAFQYATSLAQDQAARRSMGEYLKVCVLDWENHEAEQSVLCELCSNILQGKILLSVQMYEQCKNHDIAQLLAKHPKMKVVKASASAVHSAGERILRYTGIASNADANLAEKLCAEGSGLEDFLLAFSNDYGKGCQKWVMMHCADLPIELKSKVRELLETMTPRSSSVFGKLLRK